MRYAVIRVPTGGRPALIVPPNLFSTLQEAEARIAEIEAAQRMTHHTHLEVEAFDGELDEMLSERGILR